MRLENEKLELDPDTRVRTITVTEVTLIWCTILTFSRHSGPVSILFIAERLFVIVLCHHDDKWPGYWCRGPTLCTPAGRITTACPVSRMKCGSLDTQHSLVHCYYETLPTVVATDHSTVCVTRWPRPLLTHCPHGTQR